MITKKIAHGKLEIPQEFVSIDVETTGRSPENDDIIELSAVRYQSGKEIDSYESLAKPRKSVSSFISHLTGITNDMLTDAPSSAEVVFEFIKFAGSSVLVGHNIVFDMGFLKHTAARNELPEVTNECIDTLPIMRNMYPGLNSYKLAALVESCNLTGEGFHRAGYDSRMTAAVLLHIANSGIVNQNHGTKKSQIFSTPKHIKASEITFNCTDYNPDNPCNGKVFVFTGDLKRLSRREAMQEVISRGGLCRGTVTRKTNYLVEGSFENVDVGEDGESTKQQKARELQLKGYDICVISESVFLDMLE